MKISNFILFAIVLGGLTVASCNTVKGAGKDVQSVGKTVSETAEGAK